MIRGVGEKPFPDVKFIVEKAPESSMEMAVGIMHKWKLNQLQ